MKSFIYGRPAVEGGDRGYRIFKHKDISAQELKQIKELFSDEDPDVRKLQDAHFLPFYSWFPWRDEIWIFCKARIEARGRLGAMYYSYLCHGVLLDAEQRAALRYNPFVLADFFDLSEQARGTAPQLPPKINEKGLILNLGNKAAELAAGDDETKHAAGRMVETCMHAPAGARYLYTYDGRFDSNFWGLLYFFLPPSQRTNISMTSWAPFLIKPTTLAGEPDRPSQSRTTQQLLLEFKTATRTVFTDLINRLGRKNTSEQSLTEQMRLYEATVEDIDDQTVAGGTESETHRAHLEHLTQLFRAMERPSVQSAKQWPGAGRHSYPFKQAHFERVWAQNGAEREHFPELADILFKGLCTDYVKLPEREQAQYQSFWQRFFQQVSGQLGTAALSAIYGNQRLCSWLVAGLKGDQVVSSLSHRETSAAQLAGALTGLQKHPASKHIQGELVRLWWGRYLREARRGWSAKLAEDADRLEVLHSADKTHFAQASQPLLQSRWLEYVAPHLQKRPFVETVLGAWSEMLANQSNKKTPAQRMARLRLIGCLKGVYGTETNWPDRFQYLSETLRLISL